MSFSSFVTGSYMTERYSSVIYGGNVTVTMDKTTVSSPSASPSSRALQLGSLGVRGRPAGANAARERSRVQTLRHAFLELQRTLPSVPPDTKLSKLDVLILATTYIAHLTRTLQEEGVQAEESTKQTEVFNAIKGEGYLHPVKKWPMRSRLYIGATGQFLSNLGPAEDPSHTQLPPASRS